MFIIQCDSTASLRSVPTMEYDFTGRAAQKKSEKEEARAEQEEEDKGAE